MNLSILEGIEAELTDVEHALQRLDEGTYGTCEACGKPIDEERLAARPATRLCLEDQERAELVVPVRATGDDFQKQVDLGRRPHGESGRPAAIRALASHGWGTAEKGAGSRPWACEV